ncbi:putative pre-16S rRNA nuclease isoform X2 [Phoenix dactylifera]|uniref:Pre-16S rRNA nuclease isoform X2 n=1 Tax=Phoenix dactylifera TaxID=42345 RepID=A0A8B8J3U7_PHODC|nr:putative pre-16S rRNA nuclease isoform X2 [Phoenix dactylifera]
MQQRLSWTLARPPPSPLLHPTTSLSSTKPRLSSIRKIRARVWTPPSCSSSSSSSSKKTAAVELDAELLPNARRRKSDPRWSGAGFSLGVDLGASRTGLALGKGFFPRPLTVLELRGQKLELRLLEIAERKEVDEFIIGLPKSSDGKETPQSNKVRSIAGRLAVRAAERGLKRSARQGKIDAYSAVMLLERYFSMSGCGAELVVPKQLELQEKLRKGPCQD